MSTPVKIKLREGINLPEGSPQPGDVIIFGQIPEGVPVSFVEAALSVSPLEISQSTS